MGLFSKTQTITVGLSDSKYIVELVETKPISKSEVDLIVKPGSVAVVGNMSFKGRNTPYPVSRDLFVSGKNEVCQIYLYPDKMFDSIQINFFGGQHQLCISSLKKAKGKFSIVGNASIEISDYKDLINYFKKSLTRDDLVEEINKNYRMHLTNEISAVASQYIKKDTTEVELQSKLNEIAADVMRNSRKTSSMLINMGLALSQRGISMHLNSLDDTDETIKVINDALKKHAIDSLGDEKLDRDAKEKEAERKFEIDKIRADHTTITENESRVDNVRTISNTGPAPVIINENTTQVAKDYFCDQCGNKCPPTAKFCNECGSKINR